MDYCKECKTTECNYIEVCKFFAYIDDELKQKFELYECPDKMNLDYTCDMVWINPVTKERIYVEIKEVKYGFGNNEDKNIAEDNGQEKYATLISKVVSQADIEKEVELNDFIITIPRVQIGKKDFIPFCEKLQDFINANSFEEDEYTFIYKRGDNDIKILFSRKTNEITQTFGEDLLFAYNTGDNNRIDYIFENMKNVDVLKKMIIHNLENTSEKKFPKGADRKILLNILRLPIGKDVFFNGIIHYIIDNLMNESYISTSAANESYLLYYCDDFYETIMENGTPSIKQKGKVLFIIPLISKLMKEAIGYQLP